MATSIDELSLNIVVNSKGTTRTINSISKSIEKLTNSISTFDAKGLHKKFDSLFRILNNADATGFANLTKNLSGVANAFSKITNASKIDTKGLYSKFNSLTRIITPFVDKVKEGETSLVALSQTLKAVKTPTSTGGGSTSKGGKGINNKNLNIFTSLGKWSYMINMSRHYGQSLAKIVQLSMDYVETQNLWQVANRNNLEMAEQFIQKMNKAYGVSEATLMNYQAIFKNMLSALGDLSEEISSGLSMQLTQMALDFSSLYNVSIPSAMQKFQAVLSGQVRPIRSISGYDITENTIFDLYAGAGGEKTMRQLSQIEKRLLRIVAVFDQMSGTGATGDMAKTIESASNQARIMNEQFKETMTWTGQIILMWLDSMGVFQHINAFLITMKEIIRAIAFDLGYSEKNFLDGLVTSAEDAGEAVDDIQGKLLSFDKFEALNSGEDNVLGIDKTVLQLLERVKYETEEFTMQAQQIAQGWLDALGFVDKNGDGILDITEKARNLLDVVKSIGITLSTIIGLKLISKITGVTKGMSVMEAIIKSMTNIISTGIMVGGIYLLIKGWELFNSSDMSGWQKAITIIISLAAAIGAAAAALHLLKGNWVAAIGVGAAIGGIGLSIGSKLFDSTPQYANGGFPEDGLFFANSGEMVGGFSNGKTAVANNDQIVTGITQGVYNAMMAYNAQTRGQSGSGDVYLNGQKVGRLVARGSHQEMLRAGYIRVNE